MIVVSVQLISAKTGKITDLGRMLISNDGTSTDLTRGHYDAKLGRKGKLGITEVHQSPQKTTRIEDYPRESYPVWELVKRALNRFYP